MDTIESTTLEKRPYVVTTTADPTAVLPSFSVGKLQDPGTYVDGEWSSSWDTTTGEISLLSPVVGEGGALDLTSRGVWRVWGRWTVPGGAEVPVLLAEILRVV